MPSRRLKKGKTYTFDIKSFSTSQKRTRIKHKQPTNSCRPDQSFKGSIKFMFWTTSILDSSFSSLFEQPYYESWIREFLIEGNKRQKRPIIRLMILNKVF